MRTRPAKPLRVYDARGRERFVRAGATVPAGWFNGGNPPVLLTEDATVGAALDEGNPYDEGSEGREYLILETAKDRLHAAQAVVLEQAGRAEAARLNDIAEAAGLRPGRYGPRITFSPYLCGEAPAVRMTGRHAPITEQELRDMLPDMLACQARDDAKARRKSQVESRQARLAAAYTGIPDVRGMTIAEFERCGWVSAHIGGPFTGCYNSRPCKPGEWCTYTTRVVSGDFSGTYGDSGDAWHVSNPAGDHTEATEQSSHPIFRAAMQAGRRAYRQGRDVLTAVKAGMGDVAARMDRIDAAKAKAGELKKLRLLREAGLRADEARAAMASAAEESRLRDISQIRRDWRKINSQSWRARSAGNGWRSSYHPDALALLDKIEAAQRRAMELRSAREWREREADAERRTRAERAAVEAAEKQKQTFIGSAWASALDELKF